MNDCLWCDEPFFAKLSWRNLFGFADEPLLCDRCQQSLRRISGEICRYCGRMREAKASHYFYDDVCFDCLRWEADPEWRGVLRKNRSLFVYNSFLKEVMARYKFRGDAVMIKAIKREWQQLLKKEYPHHQVVPIPLSAERLYERGFNQSLQLATFLRSSVSDCLIRPQHEEKQSKKTRGERLRRSESLFHLKESVTVKGEDIVLIDDIYTTGATVRYAASTLLHAGASSVSSLTVAR